MAFSSKSHTEPQIPCNLLQRAIQDSHLHVYPDLKSSESPALRYLA